MRRFLHAGQSRLDEATILLDNGRTLGAVYLAGYAVECFLKSMILAQLPEHRQLKEYAAFRGVKSHDYGWLRQRYWQLGGPAFPVEAMVAFTILDDWQTHLRYLPLAKYNGDEDEFFNAVSVVRRLIEERL